MRTSVFAATLVVAMAGSAGAHETKSFTLADGTVIPYVLVLPDGYDPSMTYAGLLAFPGGDQSLSKAVTTTERFWEPQATKRGVIVVVPAAPSIARPYYMGEGSVLRIPEIIAAMRAAYPIKDGPMHVGGHSNGGVTAFRTAIRWPEEFSSLTVIAGVPAERVDFSRIDRLKDMRVSMFVGIADLDWKNAMAETQAVMKDLGIASTFTIVQRSAHALEAMSYEKSGPVFDTVVPAH